ncbi:MAG: dihydropteroate synthase [Clostridia bacterium]|jgi:dihydropteroate synthase|nr:dihydropteroate synthase [Clostridia bacterium]MDD4571185.1 dihydropteroate synthase [Clostridia bacterium]
MAELKKKWQIPLPHGGELVLGGRTLIMGILNVTPDSFSDGGKYTDFEKAVAQAKAMLAAGADIIDVGGESTRPGASYVEANEEIARVVPVIKALAGLAPISIDTYKPEVALAALEAGADIINDIWGLQAPCDNGEMASLAAKYNAPVVAMHNQNGTEYANIIEDMLEFFKNSLSIGLANGMTEEQFIFDIGFGFGKNAEQNLYVLRKLKEFWVLGRPLFVGTSRKSTIGKILNKEVDERIFGTAATVAIAVAGGADIVRVHDVAEMADVVKVSDSIMGRQ